MLKSSDNSGGAENTSPANPPDPSGLTDIVAESKARLASEATVPVRKRGRPPGSTKNKSESSPLPPPPAVEAVAAVEPMPDLAPVLAPAVKFAFAIPARNTGFEGFNASDEEALQIATQLDQCAKHYFPQVSEKTSLILVTLATIGFVSGAKYMAYLEWAERNKKPNSQESGRTETTQTEDAAMRAERERVGIPTDGFFAAPQAMGVG